MAMIPKLALVDGALYRGLSVRTAQARWDAEHGKFRYRRNMAGCVFNDYYAHPEDESNSRFTFAPHSRVV